MNKEAVANIKAAFAANPNATEFHANEHGHCFASAGKDTVIVLRSDYLDDKKKKEVDADPEGPKPEEGKKKK